MSRLNRTDPSAVTALITMPPALVLARNLDLPIRAITQGPKCCWFGYYDKMQDPWWKGSADVLD